ncbi:hypothetical protein ACFLQ0_04115, partial [Nitrospinota bacterium]
MLPVNDGVPGLWAIRKHRVLWEEGWMVPCICNPNFILPTGEHEDLVGGAFASINRELGEPVSLEIVPSLRDLLKAIDYLLLFTTALSKDESLCEKVDCCKRRCKNVPHGGQEH